MTIPRPLPLILKPTPLHRLDRLSRELCIDLWIKRDDLTGFAFGGNKGRKLEYLMADVLSSGADTVVTCGSTQSNFVRQLGAACARFDIGCSAVVMDLPYEIERPAGPSVSCDGGNALLNRLLGVDLVTHPDGTWEELYRATEAYAVQIEASGKRVYRIPIGGSSPLGAYAFVEATQEIASQAEPFDQIVFASSSGSTHVGLSYGLFGGTSRVLGIACDPEPEIAEDFSRLMVELDQLVGLKRRLTPQEFELDFRFVGPGYGVPSEAGDAATVRLARAEAIFLDPIYTAKAFAGLIKLANEGRLSGRTLFWHTGGLPALFAS